MRLVLASDNFYPELSGITDSLILMIKELTNRGHQVLVLAPRYSRPDYQGKSLELKIEGLTVCRLPSLKLPHSPTGQGRIALPLGTSWPMIKNFKPEIIHTHSPFGAGLEALRAARHFNLPLVGTNHTPMAEFTHYSPIKIPGLNNLMARYFNWYYHHCQFISTPSQALLSEMIKHGLTAKAKPISNPIDSTGFKPVKDEATKAKLRQRFNLTGPVVLYTGRLAAEKHIDVIIKAWPQVRAVYPAATLALTGRGAAEAELKNLVKRLGLGGAVNFLGFVSNDDLALTYQASDLFVIMSTAESQSLSLFQALASGLPVIGARARALPEFISQAKGRLVRPGQVDDLAKNIIELLGNPKLAQDLGQQGLTVAQQYSPNKVIAEWEQIYQTAIKTYAHPDY